MIEYNLPPSSNWLRPYTYNVVALDVSKMKVQALPEVPISLIKKCSCTGTVF